MSTHNLLPIEELEIESLNTTHKKLDTPFVVRGGVKDWKAINLWSNDYLLKTAGTYSVNVKPKADFVDGKSMREIEENEIIKFDDAIGHIFNKKSPDISYIRESDLLTRCPALAKDIQKPICLADYKPYAFPRTGSFDPKIWIGPKNTVAQLHWDPEHNFYAQVMGIKKIIIIPPNEHSQTYPNKFSIGDLEKNIFFSKKRDILCKLKTYSKKSSYINNTEKDIDFRNFLKKNLTKTEVSLLCDFLLEVNNCEVNAETPDFKLHPKFKGTKRFEVILEPGDLLFLPYFWFHYVRSLEPSISVNWFFLPEHLSCTINRGQQLDILLNHLIP